MSVKTAGPQVTVQRSLHSIVSSFPKRDTNKTTRVWSDYRTYTLSSCCKFVKSSRIYPRPETASFFDVLMEPRAVSF